MRYNKTGQEMRGMYVITNDACTQQKRVEETYEEIVERAEPRYTVLRSTHTEDVSEQDHVMDREKRY